METTIGVGDGYLCIMIMVADATRGFVATPIRIWRQQMLD